MPADTLTAPPAYLWIPERRGSYGDEAVDLAAMAGRDLDDEQVLAVDALLSYGPGGRWCCLESAVIEGRQNGKTGGVLLPVVLFDLFLLPPDRIVWTAHRFRTSRDAFSDFCACIDTSSELSRRVKKITHGAGDEAIELHNGARLEFLARSQGGGRGLGGKRLVMDEALFLSADAMGALIPTLSARPSPQITYGSSAGVESSDHLRSLRDRGRAGGDPSLVWVEWCAPGGWLKPGCAAGVKCSHLVGVEGCALDDEELWAKANHTLGRRISVEYVRSERRALPPKEFGRERLGWFDEDPAARINGEAWAGLVDVDSTREGDVAIAVDISPWRDFAAVAMFGRRVDELGHVQLLDYRPGTEWIVGRLVELVRVLDPVAVGMGSATYKSLSTELAKAGITVPEDLEEPVRGDLAVAVGAEMAAGCGQFLDAVRQGSLRHLGEKPLDDAVDGAKTRQVGDAIAWARTDGDVDVSPLVAATVARWAYHTRAHLVTSDYDPLDSVI